MKRRFLLACLTLLFAPAVDARDDGPATKPPAQPLPSPQRRAVDGLQAPKIMRHVKVLCDEKLEGREAGSKGAWQAAAYIADRFREAGLSPGGRGGTFYQGFSLTTGPRVTSAMEVEEGSRFEAGFAQGKDYMPIHVPKGRVELKAAVALVGYGIRSKALSFDEYEGVEIKGKAVVMFSGGPWSERSAGWIRRVDPQVLAGLDAKVKTAAEQGAAMVLLVQNPLGWRRQLKLKEELRGPDQAATKTWPIPVVNISRGMAHKLTGMKPEDLTLAAADMARHQEPLSRSATGRTVRFKAALMKDSELSRNVIAARIGRDPDLRQEAVIIGAHFDHLGTSLDRVYRGANDNASGVSVMLEIAAAFGRLPKAPRRTVIFMAFGAEEVGRRGSEHYVAHPLIPMERTALMINFDMVGRNAADELFAVGTRSSPQVHLIHQEMNAHVGLKLTHPESFRLGRSDHTAFYRARVPICYFFGGLHDGYHSPRDTPDLLEPTKMEKVARLAFLTAWRVAEAKKKPGFEPPE